LTVIFEEDSRGIAISAKYPLHLVAVTNWL